MYSELLKILDDNIYLSKSNELQVIDLSLIELSLMFVIEFGIVVDEIY